VQIFADPECTKYADGSVATVYARVNVPWALNESWSEGRQVDPAGYLSAQGPTTENPDDPYGIMLWVDWLSEDSGNPYQTGEIVPLTPMEGAIPVDNPTVIFTKP